MLRTILRRRQLATLQPPGSNISIQQDFQPFHDNLIPAFTRDKLPLIKTSAIIQQQFYVTGKYRSAVGIDSMVQLLFDVFKTAVHRSRFALRQMQRLLLAVRKKV